MKTFAKCLSLTATMGLALSLIPLSVSAQSTTVRYANWNLGTEEENNLQRQMVAAYQEANPDVVIELVDMSGDGGWEEKLTNLAARGELPDVFMANNTPYYIQNGWIADLTEMVAGDADWEAIPEALRSAVTVNDQVMALPSSQFVMGYFINHDLFDAANLDIPTYGISPEDFFAATSALTNVQQNVLGLHEMEPILGWYPSTQDSSLMWFGFDGEHMNYNSDAFKSAVNMGLEMLPHTWQGLTEDQRATFASAGPWELFVNQESGAVWEGGWAIPSFDENATFNWDFLGIPGGNQAMVADMLVVSATSANAEAAYDFARWMSFSSEGYTREAELAVASETVPNRMPVSISPESIDVYMSFFGDKPGLRQALENLDNSLVESLAKIIPGYINARWEGKPGIDIGENLDVNIGFIIGNIAGQTYKFEDYSASLETFANNILDEARALQTS